MPRRKRCQVSGIPQIVYLRGHNGAPVFTCDADYRAYLSSLEESASTASCQVHAYALAGDSLYLLCTPARRYGIARMMQAVAAKYAHYFNNKYRRSGSIWNGRYNSCLVEPERYLLACHVYVEGQAADGPERPARGWSSYPHHGLGKPDAVVEDHRVYRGLAPSGALRQAAYRDLVEVGLTPSTETEIEHALRHNLVLGCDAFKDEMAERGEGRVRMGRPGRPRKVDAPAVRRRPAPGPRPTYAPAAGLSGGAL